MAWSVIRSISLKEGNEKKSDSEVVTFYSKSNITIAYNFPYYFILFSQNIGP